jgi:predicted nucleotidyltransferase
MAPLIHEKRDEIVGLCRRYRVRALELFSSAVNDRFNPVTSDIDYLVDYIEKF